MMATAKAMPNNVASTAIAADNTNANSTNSKRKVTISTSEAEPAASGQHQQQLEASTIDSDHESGAMKSSSRASVRAASSSSATAGPGSAQSDKEKERKIGHRRVDDAGQVSYKKIATNHLMGSIQLGIQHSLSAMARHDERDLLMQDFMTVETVSFPKNGSQTTPAHSFSDFTFRTVAPLAFRYFLNLFGVRREDFMMSICHEPMRELSNPGASGSIFYLTDDDEFILKTVQHKEAEFLQKLLPGYYMNLNQNPHTLLPKFFGMYLYQCNQKNIRLTVMNNLLPSNVKMHLKFDLKGSTYKRKASKHERAKKSPTYKDLDFMDMLPDGLLLESETYNALISTLRRDCRVLESFRIMDYSLLVGVHNLDQAAKEDSDSTSPRKLFSTIGTALPGATATGHQRASAKHSVSQKQKLLAHSTAMESIQAQTDPIDEQDHLPPGGIPARNHKGERLLLFLGIIDILQSYRMKKKLEHTIKSIILDGDTVSVHRPGFYAHRFLDFMADRVFKKIPSLDLPEFKGSHRKFRTIVSSLIGVGQHYNASALKHSPSRKSKRESMKRASGSGTGVMMTAAQAAQAASAAAQAMEKNRELEESNTPPPTRRNRANVKDSTCSADQSDGGLPAASSPVAAAAATPVDESGGHVAAGADSPASAAAAAAATSPTFDQRAAAAVAEINLPAVLWDRPLGQPLANRIPPGTWQQQQQQQQQQSGVVGTPPPVGQQQHTASSSSSAASSTRTVVQRGASVEHHHSQPQSQQRYHHYQSNHSVNLTSSSSGPGVGAAGARAVSTTSLGASSSRGPAPDVVPSANLGSSAPASGGGGTAMGSHVARPRNRLHEQVKQSSTDVSSDRLSSDIGDHGTPSRLSVGAGSCGWNTPTPTWTEGTPSYTESSYSGGGGERSLTGNTPSRSRGASSSRDSLVTRNWKGSPYHETEI